MAVISVDAIILQVFAYGETSKILRLLTATHGLLSVMARGARRPRSQYGGVLEPFSRGNANLYIRGNRDIQTLSGFDLTHSGQALGADLLRFGGASLLSEIVLRTTMEEPNPRLFELVVNALRKLETETAADLEAALLGETWRLATCLGFEPELSFCLECGRDVPDGEDARFDYGAGGIRCSDCGATAPGRDVPGTALDDLRRMVTDQPVSFTEARGHWWLLTRYLDHHVLQGSTLHSMAFIDSARGHP